MERQSSSARSRSAPPGPVERHQSRHFAAPGGKVHATRRKYGTRCKYGSWLMKIGFDRRQFLAASAGALSITLMPRRSLWAAAGTAVPPARALLLKRVRQLSGDTVTTSRVQRAGGLIFFTQRPQGADNFKLFVRDGAAGHDRVLVDPTQESGAKSHVSLDWWRASPDGRHVVYGLSKDGSEDSTLHVLAVADGSDLPERIANTQDANPQWLDDGSGFFYNQLTGAVDTPERFLDSQARFHKLGTDPASDPILMKRGLDPRVEYERIQLPEVQTFSGSEYALLVLTDVRTEFRVFIAPVADAAANKARWVAVAGFEDEITDVAIDSGVLWLLANKDHPRGRILKTSVAAPSVATATEVVPEGSFVIESTSRARDGLYLKIMDGGISRLRRLTRDDRVAEIALPFEGTLRALA